MKDIKEMLKSGDKTPDELRAILEKEIAEAQEEMKKQESESIETRRNDIPIISRITARNQKWFNSTSISKDKN